MKIKEAKQIAVEWISKQKSEIPGYCGVMYWGSINSRDEKDEMCPTSDIDIRFYQFGKDALIEQAKLEYKGINIDASYEDINAENYVERVLSWPYEAVHFSRDNIIDDPTGRIRAIYEQVAPQFGDEKWIRVRLERVRENAERNFATLSPEKKRKYLFKKGFCLAGGIKSVCSLLPTVMLEIPTNKRSIIVARDILARYGRQDIADRIIQYLGSGHLDREIYDTYTDILTEAGRYAISITKTPFWGRFQLNDDAWAFAMAELREFVEKENYKEGAHFIMGHMLRAFNAIDLDGKQPEKDRYLGMANEILASLGIRSMEDYEPRRILGLEILDDVYALCLKILEERKRPRQP